MRECIAEIPYFGDCRCLGPPPKLDRSERVIIGFSVRNKNFDKGFFGNAFRLVRDYDSDGIVVILDYPYAFNDAAENGLAAPTETHIAKNRRIGDERQHMVEKVVRTEGATNVQLLRWESFADEPLIHHFRDEIENAVRTVPEFRNDIIQNAVVWLEKMGHVNSEYFLNFQIQELPVLFYFYYVQMFLIDIYPGPNFSLFQQIEDGLWRDELPSISASVGQRKLSFLDVSAKVVG